MRTRVGEPGTWDDNSHAKNMRLSGGHQGRGRGGLRWPSRSGWLHWIELET